MNDRQNESSISGAYHLVALKVDEESRAIGRVEAEELLFEGVGLKDHGGARMATPAI